MRLNIPQLRRWHLAGLLLLLSALLAPARAADEPGLKVASLLLQDRPVDAVPDVLLRPPGQKTAQRQALTAGQALPPGTELTLPRGATAVLVSRNDNRVTLFPGSVFIVGAVTDRGESHRPVSGKAEFDVRRALDFFNVNYERFTAAVKGTVYSVDISPASQTIAFDVREGKVEVEQRVPLRVRAGAGAAAGGAAPASAEVQVVDEIGAGQRRSYDLSVDRYLKEFGNFSEAEDFFTQGLAEAERSGNPQRVHRAVVNLMSANSALRKNPATLDLAQRCEDAARASRLPQAMLSCDTQVGNALAAMGRHREALERHQRVLDSERARLGQRDGAWLATALNNLAISNRALGQIDLAIQQYREGLQMRERLAGGVTNLEIIRLQSNLASALLQRAAYKEALSLTTDAYKALAALQKGKPHPLEARLAGDLGYILMEIGNYADAIEAYQIALDVLEKLFPGTEHLDKASHIAAIGFAEHRLNNEQRARERLEASLAMRKRLLGKIDHADIAGNLSDLGSTLHALGERQAALQLRRDALAMRQRLLGDGDHPVVAGAKANLALSLAATGALPDALAQMREVVAMYRRIYGNVDHPEIARNLYNVGDFLLRQDKPAEAVAPLTQSLAMRQRLFNNKPHPSTAHSLVMLARAEAQAGHADRAIELQGQALRIREAIYEGQPHNEIVASLRSLADLAGKAGRAGDAAAYRSRADNMQRLLAKK